MANLDALFNSSDRRDVLFSDAEDEYKETEVIGRGDEGFRAPGVRKPDLTDRLAAFAGANPLAPHRGVIIIADRSYSVDRVMDAINAGLCALPEFVVEDPCSASTVDLALISFGSDVKVHNLRSGGTQASDDFERDIEDIFVSGKDFPHNLELEAHGLTHLNDALVAACDLERVYAHHIFRKTQQVPHKTLFVLLTDGRDEPGGDITEAADRVNELIAKERIELFAFGYGDYSPDEFAQLCRTDRKWYGITDTSGDKIVNMFKLLGASLRQMSYDGGDNTERQRLESNMKSLPEIKPITLDQFLNSQKF